MTIKPHPGQFPIYQSKVAFPAAIAGTGSGKTVLGMTWVALQMTKTPDEQWLIAEPTWPMVDRILMTPSDGRPSLLQIMRTFDRSATYRKADRIIYSELGTIFLASAAHPETMEGAHVAGAWLDEAGQMSHLAFETATRRTSYKSGQLLVTTTPYNRGWLFQKHYKKWLAGDPDYFVSRFNSLANPKYPREIYERNRRNMTEERFRMFHEGSFERPEGMIYTNWDDSMTITPFVIPDSWQKTGAVDFGFNHPFASVLVAKSADGVYYVYKEYRRAQAEIPVHAQALKKMSEGWAKPDFWVRDPAGKDEGLRLLKEGIPTSLANNAVQAGIDTLNSLMGAGRFKVFNDCTFWLEEIEGYVWDNQAGVFIDKPTKIDDDLMDATRYAIHTQETRTGLKLFT